MTVSAYGVELTVDDALAIARAAEQRRVDVIERVAPSVVCVFEPSRGEGGGGVLVTDDGYGLTNFHVVMNMMSDRRGLGGLSDGKLYPLEVLGIDPTGDVAMFRLTGMEKFAFSHLGDSDTVRIGQEVFAMGNPFALAEDYTATVTHGMVSGVHRYQFGSGTAKLVYTDCIQVDASINPGNSGGPLFNMDGEVIGINGRASFEQRGRVNVGIGYAISINQIRRFIPGLRAGLLTEHGALGATVMDIGFEKVVFEKMLEPSVASAAGIAVGDELLAFNGEEIRNTNHFANLLGTYPADWPVTVTFRHRGEELTRRLRLERLPLKTNTPYEADAAVNERETRRVLDRFFSAVTAIPDNVILLATGRRAAGEAEAAFTREDRHAGFDLIRFDHGDAEYNQRTWRGLDEVGEDERQAMHLWAAARRTLWNVGAREALDSWRFRGGDDWDDAVAEVLEYRTDEHDDLLVSFDPATGLACRVRWKRVAEDDEFALGIELELRDYKEFDGHLLPHKLAVVSSMGVLFSDQVDAYSVKQVLP